MNFCDFINYLDFDSVEIFDPHSDVATALIKNVRVISPGKMIADVLDDIELASETPVYSGTTIIYFPDAGAMKRYKDIPLLKAMTLSMEKKTVIGKLVRLSGLKFPIKKANALITLKIIFTVNQFL